MIHRLSPVTRPWSSSKVVVAVLLLVLGCYSPTTAQSEDAFGDGAADPVKLFERGQNAHAHGDLLKALEFYEEAIKVRPEFPEAEFQRGNALVALGRLSEGESSFRRAIELRKDWSLPYSALGALLVRLNRDSDAEGPLRQAIKLDAQNNVALRMLADVRLRAGDAREATELARRATSDPDSSASAWLLRAMAERASGDNVKALVSLERVLQIDRANFSALMERAEIRIAGGDFQGAIADLKTAELLIKGEKTSFSRLAADYQLAGRAEDASSNSGRRRSEPVADNGATGELKVAAHRKKSKPPIAMIQWCLVRPWRRFWKESQQRNVAGLTRCCLSDGRSKPLT